MFKGFLGKKDDNYCNPSCKYLNFVCLSKKDVLNCLDMISLFRKRGGIFLNIPYEIGNNTIGLSTPSVTISCTVYLK